MEKTKTGLILLITGLAILTVGLLGRVAFAQEATPEPETPTQDEAAPDTDGHRRFVVPGRWGGFGRGEDDAAWLEHLAAALGITVERLEEARDQAYDAMVADAVAGGQITQERADRLLAKRALQAYIDREAILAAALEMTVEELEAARADGRTVAELMDERGIDAESLQANAQAAVEAAVQQAVADGAITQEQADEFLSRSNFNFLGRGEHRRGHGGRGFRHPSRPDSTAPDVVPETTDTGFGA